MLNVIEIGGQVQINDARLLFDDCSSYSGYGFMRRPLRTISILFFVLSKNKWTTSNFQRLLIPLQNGTATFFESDCQVFRVDNNLYAGRQAHQIICIRQRIRFVEIIDTPGQPTLGVTPSSKTADMEISHRQYFGSITQGGTYLRPKLSPPVKRPAEKEEGAFSHLLVLQSQVSFDDGRTTAHPVFVALCRLMNIHFSATLTRSSNHRRLAH